MHKKIKKNLLDLEHDRNLQFYTTTIIILATYLVGIFIAFTTKQINYKDLEQMAIVGVISVLVVGLLSGLLIKYKSNMEQVSERIMKLRP